MIVVMRNFDRPLDRVELMEACEKAWKNSQRIISDAELLWNNERWCACIFFSEIALEEIGKAYMCAATTIRLARGAVEWKHSGAIT